MQIIPKTSNASMVKWLLTGCFMIYLMVVIGGLTRLTHSGLSITDWSFMGSIPPVTESMWQERFHKYQESPEFETINYTMTLEQFKPIFLWEYVHRMTGRAMMYVFLIGFIFYVIKKRITKDMWKWFIGLFLLGIMQAVIGWWMVYSGLQKQPAVSHYRLATHLMSALTLFAFTFWFALKVSHQEMPSEHTQGHQLRNSVVVFFIILLIQIIFGAFTAGFVEGNDAHIRPGHIFNTWPKMGTEWMPEQVTMKEGFWQNVLENPSGIQFTHRLLALLVVMALINIWLRSNRLQLNASQNKGVTFLIYGVTIQFILGVFTLIYQVPVLMGALHQTGAFFLFATTLYLLFQIHKHKQIDIGDAK